MSQADAHSHDHPEFLAHHWDTPEQQFEASKLGMWLFLATEVLLFGGLFVGYTVWRFNHPEMFKFGSTFLDTTMGAINTAVLIASSLTMATAVTMAQKNKRKELIICLVLTLMGAAGFMVIKYFEYTHKFHEGYLPGIRLYEKHAHGHSWDPDSPILGTVITPIDPALTAAKESGELGLPEDLPVELSTQGPAAEAPAGLNLGALVTMEKKLYGDDGSHDGGDEGGHEGDADHDRGSDHAGDGDGAASDHEQHALMHPLQDPHRPENAHMFFNIYFMMTGLHGIHVIIGGIVIIWLIYGSAKGRYNDEFFTPVDLGGLYWHVVDLIWIFLFPLFYLI